MASHTRWPWRCSPSTVVRCLEQWCCFQTGSSGRKGAVPAAPGCAVCADFAAGPIDLRGELARKHKQHPAMHNGAAPQHPERRDVATARRGGCYARCTARPPCTCRAARAGHSRHRWPRQVQPGGRRTVRRAHCSGASCAALHSVAQCCTVLRSVAQWCTANMLMCCFRMRSMTVISCHCCSGLLVPAARDPL
jgi:hypothetical protein